MTQPALVPHRRAAWAPDRHARWVLRV